MIVLERFGIRDHAGEIAPATSTRHFPSQNLVHSGILVNVILHRALNHGGEHGGLGVEGSLVSRCKSVQIHVQNSVPAVIGGLGQGLDFRLCDVLAVHH